MKKNKRSGEIGVKSGAVGARSGQDRSFPIKTVSEANMREHWAVKNNRKNNQQSLFSILWRRQKRTVTLPATITFTRYSCKKLDSDNLAGAFKHVRDQLAKMLGIDDGSDQVKWRYGQVVIKKREHYFTVEVAEI